MMNGDGMKFGQTRPARQLVLDMARADIPSWKRFQTLNIFTNTCGYLSDSVHIAVEALDFTEWGSTC